MLTARQGRFVDEYLINPNGAQAAVKAGYSSKAAKEQASRLLTNVNVQAAITEGNNRRRKETEITQDWVLQSLRKIAERCIEQDFEPHAAIKALALLGKHLQLFNNTKVDVTVKRHEDWLEELMKLER